MNDDLTANRVTPRQVIILTIVSTLYAVLSWKLVGFKTDQVVMLVIFNSLFYSSVTTRKFILGFSIFIVYYTIFDYMKAFPNYNYNVVHIADIYHFEKRLFGINYQDKILTPNEYWRLNGLTVINVLSGIFYLCWVPVPIAFAIFLFITRRKQFLFFSLTFLLVNLIGFTIYYLYPTAPPWYVQYNGFAFHPHTLGNTGGLMRFDAYFHAGIFKSIYAKSSNVFAAMPSLHSAYPVIVLYYGLKNRLGLINVFFAIVMLGIWFAAVYNSHHYVLDVIAGIVCAMSGIVAFNVCYAKWSGFHNLIDKYQHTID